MTRSKNQDPPEKPHRSFVVSDFSSRDIPVALLAYGIISVACVVMGLAVEALTSFWRGFMFGIAAAMVGVIGLAQILGSRAEKSRPFTTYGRDSE